MSAESRALPAELADLVVFPTIDLAVVRALVALAAISLQGLWRWVV